MFLRPKYRGVGRGVKKIEDEILAQTGHRFHCWNPNQPVVWWDIIYFRSLAMAITWVDFTGDGKNEWIMRMEDDYDIWMCRMEMVIVEEDIFISIIWNWAAGTARADICGSKHAGNIGPLYRPTWSHRVLFYSGSVKIKSRLHVLIYEHSLSSSSALFQISWCLFKIGTWAVNGSEG